MVETAPRGSGAQAVHPAVVSDRHAEHRAHSERVHDAADAGSGAVGDGHERRHRGHGDEEGDQVDAAAPGGSPVVAEWDVETDVGRVSGAERGVRAPDVSESSETRRSPG